MGPSAKFTAKTGHFHEALNTTMLLNYQCKVRAKVDKVRSFFKDPQNLLRITPLSYLMRVEPCGELRENLRVRLTFAGFLLMESLIKDVRPEGFTDRALRRPPFIKHWEHEHLFLPAGALTVIEDRLVVETCLPSFLMRAVLGLMFNYRCRAMKRLLE